MSAPDVHFTANLKITSTKKVPPSVHDRRIPSPPPEREVVEVLSLVVRDETLEGLQAKIRKHLEVS